MSDRTNTAGSASSASEPVGSSARVLIALVFAVLFFYLIHPIYDTDTMWHLSVGREMVNRGEFIHAEPFSYTVPGAPMPSHEWLAQIAFYLAFDRVGPGGLVLMKALIVLTALGFVYRLTRILGADVMAACMTVMFAAVMGQTRFTERPQIFSFLFMSFLAYVTIARGKGLVGRKLYFSALGLFLVWDLFHGSVFGLLYLVAIFSGETLKHLLDKRGVHSVAGFSLGQPLPWDRLKELYLFILAVIVILLASPYGFRDYGLFMNILSKNSYMVYIREFQPMPLIWEYSPYWVSLGVTAIMMIAYRKRMDISQVFVFCGFAAISIKYLREVGTFAIMTTPMLGAYLGGMGRDLAGRGKAWSYRAVVALIMLSLVGIIVSQKFFIEDKRWRFGWNVYEKYLPVGTVRFMKASGINGNLYHRGKFGGYLAYTVTPERKIFMYEHHITFGKLFGEIHSGEYLSKYNVTYAIIEDPVELEIYESRGWIPLYWEPSAALLVKNIPMYRPYIDRYELKYYKPLTSVSAIRRMGADPAKAEGVASELASILAFREDEELAGVLSEVVQSGYVSRARSIELIEKAMGYNARSVALWTALGYEKLIAHDAVSAEAAFRKAITFVPESAGALAGLGFVSIERKEFGEAVKDFNAALNADRGYENAYFGLGVAYLSSGDKSNAKASLSEYLKREPYGKWALMARQYLQRINTSEK